MDKKKENVVEANIRSSFGLAIISLPEELVDVKFNPDGDKVKIVFVK